MNCISSFLTLIGAGLFLGAHCAAEPRNVTVYAASLTNALHDIGANFEKSSGTKVLLSFASSSTLAKQIENGAPADVFISADAQWMDYLAEKSKIDSKTRRDLLGNELVLVAPDGKHPTVSMDKDFKFADSFKGKLCTGDPERVPVGIYAKQALQHLGWWDGVAPRIVPTEDVRAALMFVERKECDFGIIYATDARISAKVQAVGTFPSTSHEPIRYPVAILAGEHPAGAAFLNHLWSRDAQQIFERYGFKWLAGKP